MDHKLIFLLSILCVSVQGQSTVEISPANDYVARRGSDETVFQCNSIGEGVTVIVWFLDGTNIQQINNISITRILPDVISDDGSLLATIRILNTERNNNISLSCAAYGDNKGCSESVLFLVQGLLDPPDNLEISAKDNFTRKLSWQAPQTLNITDVEPDIDHYTVCMTFNQTGEQSCSDVPGTDLEYLFTNVRVPLKLSLSAVNIVGEGGSSETVFHQPCDPTSGMFYLHNICLSCR